MGYLLDTDTCIFAINGHLGVVSHLQRHHPDELAVSTISLAEIWFGALKSKHAGRTRRLADAFLRTLMPLDFTRAAAQHYADIRYHLERQGTPIGERDQMIAATARAERRTLITHNLREFERVPRLDLMDWTDS